VLVENTACQSWRIFEAQCIMQYFEQWPMLAE